MSQCPFKPPLDFDTFAEALRWRRSPAGWMTFACWPSPPARSFFLDGFKEPRLGCDKRG